MRVVGGKRFQPVPSVPTNVSAGATSTSAITLTWSASKDALNRPLDYLIFIDGSTGPLATVSALTFAHTGLAANSTHTYQVIARATPAVSNPVLSGKSSVASATTQALVGTGPSAPSDFYVTLQGQSAQGSSQFATGQLLENGQPASFHKPDKASICVGWPDAVAGTFPIAHYEVEHSTDLLNWSSPTGGAAISTTAANAQGTRFEDVSVTNPVSSTYLPVNGQYLAANTYYHRLRAVDTQGTPSPWVTGAKQYIFNGQGGGKSTVGGFKWDQASDLSSGYAIDYAVADPTYGFVATIDMSAAGGGYYLPPAGGNYCTYNQNVGAADYMYILAAVSNAAAIIQMHGEIVGDLKMQPGGAPAGNLTNGGQDINLSKYVSNGTVLANTVQLYKIPLTHLMVPQSGWAGSLAAVGVRQFELYKVLMQAQVAVILTIAKWWVGPDDAPPSVPTGLAATPVSSTQIHLTWNASID